MANCSSESSSSWRAGGVDGVMRTCRSLLWQGGAVHKAARVGSARWNTTGRRGEERRQANG
jgi:hypothetical protein